jgi:hypothetical protein
MSAIQLDEFKAHLNLSRSVDDAEVQRVLDAAETWVGDYIGRPLAGASRTYTARAIGGMLVLPVIGLQSVDSITDPYGASWTFQPWQVDLGAGTVVLWHGGSRHDVARSAGIWTVAATSASYLPADVKLATLIIGKHLWETQRMAQARPGFNGTPGQPGEVPVPAGFAIPNRARDLLSGHWLPGLA